MPTSKDIFLKLREQCTYTEKEKEVLEHYSHFGYRIINQLSHLIHMERDPLSLLDNETIADLQSMYESMQIMYMHDWPFKSSVDLSSFKSFIDGHV